MFQPPARFKTHFRESGYTTVAVHQNSECGRNARDMHRSGWRFAGVDERGLFVFEDVSLLGRIRCFLRREKSY